MLPAARRPRTLFFLLAAAVALVALVGAGDTATSASLTQSHGASTEAPQAAPAGLPECPATVGEIVQTDAETRQISDRDTWQDWSVKCSYRSPDDPGNGQPRNVGGTLTPYGSMSLTVRLSIGARHNACPVRGGSLEAGTNEGSYSTGATYTTGSGELESGTSQVRANWNYVQVEGVDAAVAEALIQAMVAQAEALAIPCEPAADKTFSPAGCPAQVGTRVLFDDSSTLDPELESLSNGASWQQVRCVYRFPFVDDGSSNDTVRVTAGWTDQPVDPNDGLQRDDESCTERRVRFNLGDDVIVASDTHVARVTADGDGTPEEMQTAAESVLANLEAIAATCPQPAVEETATPEGPDATATETPAICAPSGRVLDGAGRPVAGIRIELRFRGTVRQNVATGEDGRWSMITVGTTSGEEFDPALDPLELLLVAKDEEHDPRWFELRYGAAGDIPHLRFGPVLMEDLNAAPFDCVVDFDLSTLDSSDTFYEPFVGPDSLDHWDDLLEFYTNTRNVWTFGEQALGVTMDSGLPLPLYTFCTPDTPETNGQCSRADGRGAFWNGPTTVSAEMPEPLIGFGVRTSNSDRNPDHPVNREYHEFGHALLADAFGNQMPRVEGFGSNHGGLYRNASSNDSFNEGFAEFFAAMASKTIDANPFFYIYPIGRSPQSLEDNWKVWQTNGKEEEFAVAGVLLDFVDGDSDYNEARQIEINVLGSKVVENDGVADGEPRFLHATLVKNTTSEVLRRVAVRLFLDGDARTLFGVSEALQPGAEAVVLIPLADGDPDVIGRVEAFTLAAVDDDPISVGLRELWDVILAAPSSHESSNGHIVDASELYEALFGAFSGDRDGDGRDDVDEIFISHGFFADTAGGTSNRVYDDGEEVGLTSYSNVPGQDSLDPRTAAEDKPSLLATVDTGSAEANVLVQVIYDEPLAGRSYAFEQTPDEDGTVEISVPPPDLPATVHVFATADGRLPILVESFRSDTFWADAAANNFESFVALEATLVEGDPFAEEDGGSSALVLIGGIAAALVVAVVAAFAVVRMRGRSRPAA